MVNCNCEPTYSGLFTYHDVDCSYAMHVNSKKGVR